MALTFPLSLAQFFDGLCAAEAQFYLGDAAATNRDAGGNIFTHSMGAMLWQGSVALRGRRIGDASLIASKIDMLRQPGRTFYATPYGRDYPQADPTGTVLGVAAPTIQSVAGNNRDVTIQALPAGYVLTAGDFIGWDYGGRTALHQIVVGGTASGGGVLTVEVSHPVRPTVTAGTAVRLTRPYCKCIIDPESVTPFTSRRRRWSDGAAFTFTQTLRA